MTSPVTLRITSLEVRLISVMMWREAISLSRACGLVLVHDVDAVADAFGVAEVDGLADMEAKASGGTRPGASSPAWREMCTLG